MEKLLILYGTPNSGKTTTLRNVFEVLSDYTLKSRDPKGDFRVVVPIGNKYIFVATAGDTTKAIQTNFLFFESKFVGNTAIYEFSDGKLQRIDKQRLAELKADICITACRIYKDGTANDPYAEVTKQILNIMPIKGGINWILKSQSEATIKNRKQNNCDYETALSIVAEIMDSKII